MTEAKRCLICQAERDLVGAACADCREELKPTISITPEQVWCRGARATAAALVDPWGRVHHLLRRTLIGRELDEDGLLILDSTVSRRHAILEARNEGWVLRDLNSSNHTYVENRRLEDDTPLRDGERVRFGGVAFFFLTGLGAVLDLDPITLGGYTVRDGKLLEEAQPRPPSKTITIELGEPTGGGGGVAVIGGRRVQLTLPQFELISLLYRRARAGESFVQATELVRTLSLDSVEPNEDHVRQLVRRLRRALFKAGIVGLVESRYGAGYRLVLELSPP